MNKFIICLAIFAVVFSLNPEKEAFEQFQLFTAKYNKNYSSIQEYMARFQVFKKNLNIHQSNGSFKKGITKFSDLTSEEFRRIYLNLDISVVNTLKFSQLNPETLKNVTPPENFDWVADKKALERVKDQGHCGSCWSFSTVGNLEGLYFIKYGEHKRFSEQQLVDCDKVDSGCHGGLMERTFGWIKKNGGLQLEGDYKYKGVEQACTQDPKKFAVKVSGFEKLNSEDEELIKAYLYKTGPLAIALNADLLQFYDGGILDADDVECSPSGMNHAVVLVGYGSENGKDFWNVRNSWGDSFGENGYFRIARGKGTCGINLYITSAILE